MYTRAYINVTTQSNIAPQHTRSIAQHTVCMPEDDRS